jgi:hypothetical protein
MLALIKKNLSGKNVLYYFIAVNVVYLLMLFITIPKVMVFSGGMKILDMMPAGYSPDYVNTLLTALGQLGRNVYLFTQLPLDMAYPALFGISYCLVLAYLLNRLGKLETKLIYLCLLPVVAGFFDYCENFGIITMILTFPENSVLLSQATSVFSVLKSAFTTLYFTVLLISLLVFGVRKMLKKRG